MAAVFAAMCAAGEPGPQQTRCHGREDRDRSGEQDRFGVGQVHDGTHLVSVSYVRKAVGATLAPTNHVRDHMSRSAVSRRGRMVRGASGASGAGNARSAATTSVTV